MWPCISIYQVEKVHLYLYTVCGVHVSISTFGKTYLFVLHAVLLTPCVVISFNLYLWWSCIWFASFFSWTPHAVKYNIPVRLFLSQTLSTPTANEQHERIHWDLIDNEKQLYTGDHNNYSLILITCIDCAHPHGACMVVYLYLHFEKSRHDYSQAADFITACWLRCLISALL